MTFDNCISLRLSILVNSDDEIFKNVVYIFDERFKIYFDLKL